MDSNEFILPIEGSLSKLVLLHVEQKKAQNKVMTTKNKVDIKPLKKKTKSGIKTK